MGGPTGPATYIKGFHKYLPALWLLYAAPLTPTANDRDAAQFQFGGRHSSNIVGYLIELA
jgi:hypothetical protein